MIVNVSKHTVKMAHVTVLNKTHQRKEQEVKEGWRENRKGFI